MKSHPLYEYLRREARNKGVKRMIKVLKEDLYFHFKFKYVLFLIILYHKHMTYFIYLPTKDFTWFF